MIVFSLWATALFMISGFMFGYLFVLKRKSAAAVTEVVFRKFNVSQPPDKNLVTQVIRRINKILIVLCTWYLGSVFFIYSLIVLTAKKHQMVAYSFVVFMVVTCVFTLGSAIFWFLTAGQAKSALRRCSTAEP